MTISSTVSRNDYVGNDVADTFDYDFKIIDPEDLLVTQRDLDGVETVLVLEDDYDVTDAGEDDGGTVELPAPLPDGYRLTIRRVVDLTQETDIRNEGEFFPETHEDAFDYGRMIDLQQQDELNRSLKLPETEAGSEELTTLPQLEDRTSRVFGWDVEGRPIAVSELPPSGVVVTAFGEILITSADADAALDSLGFSDYFETLIDAADLVDLRDRLGLDYATVSPASLGADQNNYDVGSTAREVMVRLTSGADRKITGFDGGAAGRVLSIVNIGSFTITLADANASSDAENRILNGPGAADLALGPLETARYEYDPTTLRWRLTS